jgi:hypothetical protein
MIGLVSSTIFPSTAPTHEEVRSWISPNERLEQTRETIKSLVDVGVSEIYLADNSGDEWVPEVSDLLKPARVFVFNHYQYRNKGISEIYLLLSMLNQLPANVPILKISGRYQLTRSISEKLGDADFAVKFYKDTRFKTSISTRCYMVKNKELYKSFLENSLREVYAYPFRIVGPRSFIRVLVHGLLHNLESYPFHDPRVSIENAGARVLQSHRYKYNEIPTLGVKGLVGAFVNNYIVE